MNKDEAILIGYFPKKTSRDTGWLKNPTIKEICSVSDCQQKGPSDWIDQWKHNTSWWLFDTEQAALSVIEKQNETYTLFAYKLYPFRFDGHKQETFVIENSVSQVLCEYEFLGFDIVSRSGDASFECSALSCSGCTYASVNQYCLIQDYQDALSCCKRIAGEIDGEKIVDGLWKGKWEPGPYYLVEVYRKLKK